VLSHPQVQQLVTKGTEMYDQLVTKTNKTQANAIVATGAAVGIYATYKLLKFATKKRYAKKPLTSYKPSQYTDVYDVAIVGSGPSGSCAAYYLKKHNVSKVLVLDKKKFPRDKHCGDAVSLIAQKHLKEMGVLQEIVAEKKGHFSQAGGFVSPNGNSFIGNSATELKLGDEGPVIAIKRIWMDEKMARAAQKSGAELMEETAVEECTFDAEHGIWTIKCSRNDQTVIYHSRVLISADGAPSALARKMGYVHTDPQGVCSRSYVKNNSLFKWDGVVFYPPRLLPGYCAIIREAQGELNYCVYIIPGGPTKNEDLPKIHKDIMDNDPYVSSCLGPDPEIEQMKSASLRFGGVEKSFDDHFLIIGDAAGFIDPLTGEGIQYAMESGQFAADVVAEGLKVGDVSANQLQKYQQKWKHEFGDEFYWSMKVCLLLYRFPSILDGAAKLIQKRGTRFLGEWAQVMTGGKSKTWFLRPDVAPFITFEIIAAAVRNMTGSTAAKQQPGKINA